MFRMLMLAFVGLAAARSDSTKNDEPITLIRTLYPRRIKVRPFNSLDRGRDRTHNRRRDRSNSNRNRHEDHLQTPISFRDVLAFERKFSTHIGMVDKYGNKFIMGEAGLSMNEQINLQMYIHDRITHEFIQKSGMKGLERRLVDRIRSPFYVRCWDRTKFILLMSFLVAGFLCLFKWLTLYILETFYPTRSVLLARLKVLNQCSNRVN